MTPSPHGAIAAGPASETVRRRDTRRHGHSGLGDEEHLAAESENDLGKVVQNIGRVLGSSVPREGHGSRRPVKVTRDVAIRLEEESADATLHRRMRHLGDVGRAEIAHAGRAKSIERLRDAEVGRCLQAGIRHYEAGQLPEAAFQLKKALALDPGNDEAERYLGYALGQTGDSQIADRFGRLE